MLKRAISSATAILLLWSTFAGAAPATSYAAASTTEALVPYYKASLPVDTRVADLLGRMSLDEKIGQMVQAERASVTPEDVKKYHLGSVLSGGGSFPNGKQLDSTREKWEALVDSYQAGALSTPLGIPLLYGVDAVHGQNNIMGATLFPHNIGLGATRNTELVEQIGIATAQEAKASGTNWIFGPTIADPQHINWGRTYEGFSDNQSLVAEMASAYIKGLQGKTIGELKNSDRVIASAKHFLGEGLTDNGVNQGDITGMTEQEVLDLNLPMYKKAIEAGARTVMASYNSIQGLKMHANKRILTDALKGTGEGQLGFTGFVITDYNAVQQINKDWDGNAVSGLKNQIKVAVNAGVDMLMMPADWKVTITHLKALVEDGSISQSRIDDAVTRILRVKFESGAFEHPMTDQSLETTFGSKSHRALAQKAVRESLVLLKNDKVNGQPILSRLKNMNKIFVAGKSADDIGIQSGGWSISWQGLSGKITEGTTILQGIKNTAGESKKVTYNKHGRGAAGNDVAIAVIGEKPYAESNGDGLNSLKLDKEDIATLNNIRKSGVPTIVVLVSGRPLIINDQLEDIAGLVEAWLPGTEGQGVADVLFGDYEFTGKLPIRWPFYTEAYSALKAGTSNLEQQYILFDYGYGLTKNEPTPVLPALPQKPGNALYAKVEAESFIQQQGIQLEGTADVGGGQNISYADAGDWMEYLIDVPTDGVFDIDFRHAGEGDNTGFNILNESGVKLGELSVNRTGAWQNWKTTTVHDIALTAGVQKIKLVLKAGGLNLNWFGSKGFSPAAPEIDSGGIVTPAPVIQANAVENWVTTERDSGDMGWYYDPRWQDGDKKLEQQANIDLTEVGTAVDPKVTTITIDPNKEYQSMMGIGTSMEESTVYNLLKMSPAKQDELLKKLVSKTEGIGMSMMRVTIGSADFTAQKFYSYDDMPKGETDTSLSHFSIQKDIDFGIIPALQKMVAINPELKFFASPWSPPGWMKTTDSMVKGQVKDEYLPVLADYYVKFIQEYKKQGIVIEAMTLQNEPLLEIEYPSTKMPWQQEAELAKLLKQKLTAAGLDVKLWIFDHNPGDTMSYPAPMLADSENYAAIDGTAFHDYGGDLGLMSQLHDMYPEKNVYLTERAVWGTLGTDRIAQYFRNWARSYNSWVLMLDSDVNTHQWVGTPDPTMLIQDSSNTDNYWLTPEYYFVGHFTKFVKPGYTRIDSNYGNKDSVTNVSFMSPDKKTIVTVVINQTASTQTFKLVSDGTQIAATLAPKSVATYRWNRDVQTVPGEEKVLSLTPDVLDYDVSGKEVTLNLSGGTFNSFNVNDISLSGEATDKGVTVTSVTYATYNPDKVKVKLAWDGTPYYNDVNLTLNVPATAYSDSTDGKPLSAHVKLKGTARQTPATPIPGTVSADVYYQFSGVNFTEGWKFTDIGAGDWVDFKINVPRAGKYAFTLNAVVPSGGGSAFQMKSDHTTLATFNIPSGPNNWNLIRTSADLEAGEQIIRILGSVGTFEMQHIIVEEVSPHSVDGDGILKVEAESFVKAGQNVIQVGDPITNLGYTTAGTYMDYLVTVPKSSNYKIKYNYATPQGGVSVSLQTNGQTTGTTSLPSTGGWVVYSEAASILPLTAGTQTIRLVINGDGVNLDRFQLEPTDSAPAPVFKMAAAPHVLYEDSQRDDEQIVKLNTNIVDGKIHYTTDGTLPTKDSTLYTGPVSVTPAKVLRAIVVKAGMDDSYVSFYAAAAASPQASPGAGSYNNLVNVNLTSRTKGATIYYTTDGTVPTTTSLLYQGPLTVTSDTTIKAVSIKDSLNHSAVGEFTFNITNNPNPNPGTNPVTNPVTTPGTTPVDNGQKAMIKAPKPVVNPNTGRATTTIASADLKAALQAAKPVKGVPTVFIEVEELAGQKGYEILLPVENLTTGTLTSKLEIVTAIGKIVVPSNMLSRTVASGVDNIGLTIAVADITEDGVKAKIGQHPVIGLTLRAGNQVIEWNNPKAPVTVSIPYTPSATELAHKEQITVWYIDGQGNLISVPSGRYDEKTGMVSFTTTHFGTYAVAYVNKSFTDISKHGWAKQAIEVLASKGVIQGTSDTTFAPNAKIKRADFIVLLVKALGLTEVAGDNFADVKSTAYYAEAIGIAKKLGIVQGKGGNVFEPEANITRQEMMALATRALGAAQIHLEQGSAADLTRFDDITKIAPFAVEDIATLVKNGIVSGNGTLVNPLGTATRAEASVMIYKMYNLQ
ncbi:glycoside hydrolase family 3 N-terminal domain-containing protein [Paenibacillus sp. sgz500992]|uniref:glycoside hydrolase family 3 N-terminal domain-containing protein n=1 Tax=Paenibacillus sp. sgz500992 TaxID=3242476 RepID=UPI0036D216DC